MAPANEPWVYDWNREEGDDGPRPGGRVELDDETLRDGLQSPSAKNPPIQAKRDFLYILVRMGVTSVDIGLPASGPHIAEDTLYLAREIAKNKLPIEPNCAARTLRSDILPVVDIAQKSGLPIEVACFIGSSFVRQFAEGWDMDFLLRCTEEAIGEVVGAGLPAMFVTEDTTRAHPEDLRRLYTAAIECGARRICIADTVGYITPSGAGRLVRFLKGVIADTGQDVKIDWHGHMDRGLGVVSTLAAWEAGADRLHGSALGLGERVGNTPLDLLMVNLKLMGLWHQELSALTDYVEWIPRWTGVPIPLNYPVFGGDAYRTGTGIHASAILKALKKGDRDLVDLVYSSVPASWFGKRQTIEVGPMSGESNVQYWLQTHGEKVSNERVEAVLRHAKDSDRMLTDDEILGLVRRLDKP